MNWNYAQINPDDVRGQLKAAMKHLQFSMGMCLAQ